MKIIFCVIGIMMAVIGVYAGRLSLIEAGRQTGQARLVDDRIRVLQTKVEALAQMPQVPGQALSCAYAGVVDDLGMLGKIHRITGVVHVKELQGGVVERAARPSTFEGAREIAVDVVFSGLKRRGTLLSLLDSLSRMESVRPVIMRRIYYEKDTLKVGLSVVGL